jgi:hypothetical protein
MSKGASSAQNSGLTFNSKHRLNQAADVVGQHLAQRLIDLRCFSFASQAITKLRLDHAKRGFNIASFVVLLEKPLLVKFVVVIHLPPKLTLTLHFAFLSCPRLPDRPHSDALFDLNGK